MTDDRYFIFSGGEISQYLKEIGLKAWQFYEIEEQMKPSEGQVITPRQSVLPDEWAKIVQQKGELRIWFAEQTDIAKAKFKPYLTTTE
jgi:hypothetical protein